ncbi:GDP-L-fucose synthase [soil metagenome]
MNRDARIFLAGHNGMVGSALHRLLHEQGHSDIVTASRSELDLRDTAAVGAFFKRTSPECVIIAAARVGGINANRTFPAEFLYDNLMIQNNLIHQAHRSGANQLIFLGSSCIYPRECPQPMKEEHLLTGPLEPTNEGYALAKIAGLRMAQYYARQYGMRSLCPMPCNLYGPNDSFDPNHAHVLTALVKKFVDAVDDGKAEVTLWGTGVARREFLHVDDLARAVLFLMGKWQSSDIINVGSGMDLSIRDLAEMIAEKTGYTRDIRWDASMPDGMLRKCLDVSKMEALGFQPEIALGDGISQTILEYRRLKTAEQHSPVEAGALL